MNDNHDTIVAVSTAAGIGLRGIVRLSGSAAFERVGELVPDVALAEIRRPYRRTVVTLTLADGTNVPAEIYAMPGPYSYTRDDVAELHTFGSPVLLEMIVEDLLARGVRLAEAGEFTRRAFINGRLDLAQAEAVLQVIRARSDAELRLALRQLDGRLSNELAAVRDRLLDLCALAELSIDFTDQDIEILPGDQLAAGIAEAAGAVRAVASHSVRQAGGRPGICVAIVGRPNAGKSSILNALLGRKRSIVTNLPGTTRDTVEDVLEIDDVMFRLIDTAGARDTIDIVEREAVERARVVAQAADLVLFVIDLAEGLTPFELEWWRALEGTARLAVLNKSDLPPKQPVSDLLAELANPSHAICSCSDTSTKIDPLRTAMVETVRSGLVDCSAQSFLINTRQCDALRRGAEALDRALSAAGDAFSVEFIALDLRVALDALGEITGQTCTDDILNRIFSSFCIGK